MYFKYVFQLLVFQLLHNTAPGISKQEAQLMLTPAQCV